MQRAENLAFIEFPEQIDFLLKRYAVGRIDLIIALTPYAEYALEKRGLSFKRPEDYYDEYELEEFGIANFDRVEDFCRFFDNYCQERLPYFRQHGIRPAWSNFYYFKILFDAVTIRLFALKAIFDEELPEKVIFFPSNRGDFDLRLLWANESLYCHLIELLIRRRNINAEKISHNDCAELNRNEAVSNNVRRLLSDKGMDWIKKRLKNANGWLFDIIYFWTQGNKSITAFARLLWYSLKPRSRRSRSILFCSVSYNLYWLMNHYLHNGHFITWLWREGKAAHRLLGRPGSVDLTRFSQESGHQYSRFWQELEANDEFREFFRYEDFDWFSVARERLRYFTIHGIIQASRVFAQASATFETIKPVAVLFSPLHDFWSKIVAHAARQKNIPVLSFMHGAAGACFLPMHAYTDFLGADWNFVLAPGIAAYLKKYYPEEVSPVVTGSPMLENLANQAPSRKELCRRFNLNPERKIVAYVITNFDGNHRYISYRIPSDSLLFKIQRRISAVFKNHPEIQFLIKGQSDKSLPPSPIVDVLKDESISNCKFISDYPFASMIHLADLFIVDHPLTTLLQMCVTDTPIYIFNNWLHWEEEALQKLKKRAEVFTNLEKFCAHLDKDLKSGKCFFKTRVNGEFLKHYALPPLNNSSVETMTEKLDELVENKAPHFTKDLV